jgi:1-acyl-sn-glycerol-3-phosphate acyltransferase
MASLIKDKITIKEFFFTLNGYIAFITVNTVLLLIFPLLIIISMIFDKNRNLYSYVIKVFYKIFYFFNFVQRTEIDYNGLKAPKKNERRIYVVNHASWFDVIIMFLLPGPIKSVMKQSYTKIPIIGWIATLAGTIILKDESDSGEQIDLYMNVVEKLEKGIPIVLYPEGTRSKDSKIGKFFDGPFKMALETKADIVPVAFDTWNVIRPDVFWIRDVRPTIKILDTIKYEKYKDFTYKEISKIVRFKLIKALLEVRDGRRKKFKNYYRNKQKFVDLDNEMRFELEKLKEYLSSKKIEI